MLVNLCGCALIGVKTNEVNLALRIVGRNSVDKHSGLFHHVEVSSHNLHRLLGTVSVEVTCDNNGLVELRKLLYDDVCRCYAVLVVQ